MEKPNYGGAGWHVIINLVSGVLFLLIAVVGALVTNRVLLLLLLPSLCFLFGGVRWMRGGVLEERLRIRDALMEFVQPKDGDKVLDVGTGGGLLAIGFAKAIRNGEAIGIDIWMKLGGGTALEKAKRNAEFEGVADKVKFEVGDARSIPFPNDRFDIVVESFAVHIIREERERALQEMDRVLRPGGKFAMIEPKRAGWSGWEVDARLKVKLEQIGLENVEFHPMLVYYPGKSHVSVIYGEKRG